MPKKCVVPNCLSYKSNKKVSVFTPANESLRQKWADAIGLPSFKISQHICERHFEEELIERTKDFKDKDGNLIQSVSIFFNYNFNH